MNFFGMGFAEILLILVVALIVLGPARMIETARTLGRYAREFQRATSEIPRMLSLEDEPSRRPPERRQVSDSGAGRAGGETDSPDFQQEGGERDDEPVPRS